MPGKEEGIWIKGPKGDNVFLHDGSAIKGLRDKTGEPIYDSEIVQRMTKRAGKFRRTKGGKLQRKTTVSFNCMHDE